MKNYFSKKLSAKLFVITLSSLLILIAILTIFQVFFFPSFYVEKKKKILSNAVYKFKQNYSYQLNNTTSIKSAMLDFEDTTNSKIAIFSLDGESLVSLDKYGENPDNVNSLTTFCQEIISNADILRSVLSSSDIRVQEFTIQNNSNNKKIGAVSPMSINSANDALVIVVAPIQPIEEASEVMTEFFRYLCIGFIFVSIFLSFFYSNFISKPLIKLNKAAMQMSKMNFKEKCVTDRTDEIGSLANTLNFLSSNLDSALKDLQLKNQKLKEDIEKERNLEIMRKDFVNSVSHELKTPIGIIEGYAEGIKDGIVSDENAHIYLETIIDESKKMATLVNNMLELSKLESGVIKPKFEVFNINRLIRKVISKHTLSASEKDLTIIFNENTDYSYVKADTFQMEQVFTNLITNAIKYTPEHNDIIIAIDIIHELYKISITNMNAHIEEVNLDKLFDKFYRVDKARQRNTNSTGLGLPIVKNILELHNFKYSLTNVENGVCFTFYIPKENQPSE